MSKTITNNTAMTRKLFTLVLFAVMALAATAQSAEGRWLTKIDISDQGENLLMLIELDLQKGSKAELALCLAGESEIDAETKLELVIKSFVDAKWKLKKNTLTFDINTKSIKYELTDLKINGNDPGSLRSLFENVLMEGGKEQLNDFWKMFNDNGLIVKQITNNTMTLSDGEIDMDFTRKE